MNAGEVGPSVRPGNLPANTWQPRFLCGSVLSVAPTIRAQWSETGMPLRWQRELHIVDHVAHPSPLLQWQLSHCVLPFRCTSSQAQKHPPQLRLPICLLLQARRLPLLALPHTLDLWSKGRMSPRLILRRKMPHCPWSGVCCPPKMVTRPTNVAHQGQSRTSYLHSRVSMRSIYNSMPS